MNCDNFVETLLNIERQHVLCKYTFQWYFYGTRMIMKWKKKTIFLIFPGSWFYFRDISIYFHRSSCFQTRIGYICLHWYCLRCSKSVAHEYHTTRQYIVWYTVQPRKVILNYYYHHLEFGVNFRMASKLILKSSTSGSYIS